MENHSYRMEKPMLGVSAGGVATLFGTALAGDWLYAASVIVGTLLLLRVMLDYAVAAHHGEALQPASRRLGGDLASAPGRAR
jgi:hypothetical protein